MCDACLKYAANNFTLAKSSTPSSAGDANVVPIADQPTVSPDVLSMVEKIEKGLLSNHEMECLANALGKASHHAVKEDGKELLADYKSLVTSNVDCIEYIANRPTVLVEFLKGVTGVKLEKSCSKKKLNGFALALEHLYFIRNLQFVGPISFAHGIL